MCCVGCVAVCAARRAVSRLRTIARAKLRKNNMPAKLLTHENAEGASWRAVNLLKCVNCFGSLSIMSYLCIKIEAAPHVGRGEMKTHAGIAQLVEHNLAKVGVAGPSPVFRSPQAKAAPHARGARQEANHDI